MIGFNGGLIGGLANARNTTTTKSNPGVWTLAEQRKAIFSVPTAWPNSSTLPTVPGEPFEGGYFAGYISFNADGTATHVLIVAPKATATSLQIKTSNSGTAGTTSRFDGALNSSNMNKASHPAAQYCEGLTTGGYSDWYLPADLELDIAYFNLKPGTTSNNTGFGVNDYSVPKRTSNYTAGNPAQTSNVDFRTGAAEAFLASNYWSSTELFSNFGSAFDFNTGENQRALSKMDTSNVIAFRKVLIS